MERKFLNDVMLGAFILGALALLAYMSIAVGGLKLGRAIIVSARFDSAAGLVKDSAVLIAGVNVGSVEELKVAHDKAMVRLRLKADAGVRSDVKAAIRMKSLLGEKYVELVPQSETAPMLKDGDTIALTTVPVEIDELMKQIGPVLKDVKAKDMATIVHVLATTLDGRGESLGTTLDNASTTMATLNRVLNRNQEHIDHTLENLDRTLAAAPGLVERLDRLSADLEPTTHTLADRGPSLINRLDRLSGQLEPAGEALAKRGPGLIAKADHVLDQLEPTLDRAPKTLDALQPTLSRLPKTLDTLDKLVKRLDGTLNRIEPILEQTKDRDIFDKDGSFKVKARVF